MAMIVLLPLADCAAQVVRREYAIKAGIVVMLARCVTWPPETAPSETRPLTIGILGKDPFVENEVNQLEQAAGRAQLQGGKIVIKRFESASEYEPCHVLFVSSRPQERATDEIPTERLKSAQRCTAGENVLLIGEAQGLAQQGATANLLYDRRSNVIRLELNPDAAAQTGIKFTPDVLRLKLVQIVRNPEK
jgi:hypothetical protein